MDEKEKKRKRIFSYIFRILFWTWPFYIYIGNDLLAYKACQDLIHIPLPESTTIMEKGSAAGTFQTNEHGMIYYGAMVIKSGLKERTLQKYYDKHQPKETDFITVNVPSKVRGSNVNLGTFHFQAYPDEGYYLVLLYRDHWNTGFIGSWLDMRGWT